MQYQPLSQNNASEFKIDVQLNQHNILLIHVEDFNSAKEWKQEFVQKHFPNQNIKHVAQTLQDASKPNYINERIKIFADEQWLRITVDQGKTLPTIALPNATIATPEAYLRMRSTLQPRHYVPDENTIKYKALVLMDDDADTETDEDDAKYNQHKQPLKPLESVQEGATGDTFHNKGNDIIRFVGFSLHIFIFLLTLFYGFLAIIYGVGQLYTLSLSDFWCTEMYSLEDIREYNALHNNTLGDEYSCYQIHGNVIDYERLFNADPSLSYESILDYNNTNLTYAILYFMVAAAFAFIILYDIGYILWYSCVGHKLHKHKTEKKNNTNCILKLQRQYMQYMSTDTIGWVIIKFISELIEIVIQGIALLSFGGVDIQDWDNNVLTEESWLIIGFALIILSNGICNFISWICYALFPKLLFGYLFVYILFTVDVVFDSLYAMYPIVIKAQTDKQSIGQFRVSKPIDLIQSLLPLCFLSFACFRGLSQSFFLINKGKVDPRLNSIDPNKEYMKDNIDMKSPSRHGNITYDLSGLFIKCHHDNMQKLNVDKVKEEELKKEDCISKCLLIVCAIFVLILSSVISITVIVDIKNAEIFCNQFNLDSIDSLQNTLLEYNVPELVLYDDVCRLKVYKLFAEYPCNCKLVLFENSMMINPNSTICRIHENAEILFNFTSIDIISNIFMKWDNMIRIWFDQQVSTADGYISGCVKSTNASSLSFDRKEMFAAKYMQLFYIRNLYIHQFTIQVSDYFRDLQYFSVSKVFLYADDLSFKGLSTLPNLKLIQLDTMGNVQSEHIDSLCALQQSLRSLHIENAYFEDLNDCFTEFYNLEFLLLNYVGLVNINWDVLNITSLKRLSLFASQIDFESLNNTFIANHIYNASQSMLSGVYLGGNSPICNEFENNESGFNSQSATNLIQTFDACAEGCNNNECPVYNIDDGFCQPECNNNVPSCDVDDCNQ